MSAAPRPHSLQKPAAMSHLVLSPSHTLRWLQLRSSAIIVTCSDVHYASLLQERTSYFYNLGIWGGLSQARTSTTVSSAVGARHFPGRGDKLHKWQETAWEVVKSWEVMEQKGGGILEEGQRLTERLSQCYLCPGGATAAARPVSGKGQGSILLAQHT